MRNREILAEARRHLRGNFWRAVFIMIIVAAIPSVINYVIGSNVAGSFLEPGMFSLDAAAEVTITSIIFQLLILFVIWIISSLLSIGEKWSYLQMVDFGRLEIKEIFKSFVERPGRNIWHNILLILLLLFWSLVGIVGLGMLSFLLVWLLGNNIDLAFNELIGIGIISFILIGVVLMIWFVKIWFWFILSEFILYDYPNLSAYGALRASRKLMKGYKGKLFRLALRIYLPFLLLTIILPILIFVLALMIQEQIWLLGLLAILSYIGYVIYGYLVNIRWKVVLATLYRDITFEKTYYS